MDVFEVIEKRRSVRKYKPLSVRNEDLKRILEAARLAPSAGNRQPWRFIVVQTSERKKLLAQAARDQMFLADAEASLKWCKQDVMIAVEHLVLASTSLGYGTCWIGAFEEEQVKELLGIPEKIAVVALLPIGAPDERPQAKPRKIFGEIFFEEEYNRPLKS